MAYCTRCRLPWGSLVFLPLCVSEVQKDRAGLATCVCDCFCPQAKDAFVPPVQVSCFTFTPPILATFLWRFPGLVAIYPGLPCRLQGAAYYCGKAAFLRSLLASPAICYHRMKGSGRNRTCTSGSWGHDSPALRATP